MATQDDQGAGGPSGRRTGGERGRQRRHVAAPGLTDRARRRVTTAVALDREEDGHGGGGRHHHLPGVPQPHRGLRLLAQADVARPGLVRLRRHLEVAHFTCTIALQRIALRTKAWFSVATSQLTGNAISLIVPGGDAFGAATQFRMLAAAGNDTATGGRRPHRLLAAGHRRAAGPADLRPAGHPRRHAHRQRPATCGVARHRRLRALRRLLRHRAGDGPAHPLGGHGGPGGAQPVKRKSEPMTGLAGPAGLRAQPHPGRAGTKVEGGRAAQQRAAAFDFGTLLATIRATGAKPNPSLVLLAYAVAGLLALIPITPGGLGIVEAGLSALLILAGHAGRRRRGGHARPTGSSRTGCRSSWGRSPISPSGCATGRRARRRGGAGAPAGRRWRRGERSATGRRAIAVTRRLRNR